VNVANEQPNPGTVEERVPQEDVEMNFEEVKEVVGANAVGVNAVGVTAHEKMGMLLPSLVVVQVRLDNVVTSLFG